MITDRYLCYVTLVAALLACTTAWPAESPPLRRCASS